MKMNQMMKRCVTFVIAFVLAVSSVGVTGYPVETVEAATVQSITKSTQVVCKKTAKVKIPSGYKNCKFTSSNPKVATVDKKGNFKALRLGVTKLTVQSGAKKKNYTITVVPAKKSDVRLNQEMIISGQKCQLKLVSDKYDTSQVKLKFYGAYSEIDRNGKCKGIDAYISYGDLIYSYGQFSKRITLYICDKDVFFDAIMDQKYNSDVSGNSAGVEYSPLLDVELGGKSYSVQQYKKMGLTFLLDGKTMSDKVVYTPGKHVAAIVVAGKKYTQEFRVFYSVKEALLKKDATGYSDEGKAVFDAAFAAVDQVIKDGMSEKDKVKAIHDYLIYHANYVNNGDYSTAENWAYGAGGVLLHKEGVCQSYAFAFYMMAISAGLECRFVSGTADGGGHAWNQVKVNGKWYYIDCTWDDPVGGGYENYKYYLSESLWADHIAETAKDLAEDGKYDWEHYYLTGADYAR